VSSPRVMALSYRIHCYAAPRGWDCTIREIADDLGVSVGAVRSICIAKRWTGRLRTGSADDSQWNSFTEVAGFGSRGGHKEIAKLLHDANRIGGAE